MEHITEDAAGELKARLRTDLLAAMKNRQSTEAGVIRALVAALDNAEAPPLPARSSSAEPHRFRSGAAEVERLRLTRADVHRVVSAEIQEREQAAAELERVGMADRASALRAEALTVKRYLP